MLILWSAVPLFAFADLFWNPAELAAHLNTLPMIRVFSKHAPGNGNQAANVTLIKRLRAIGYRGKIELLYDKSTKARMEFLLPPFLANGPDCQTIAELNVETCAYDETNPPPRAVRLAISAAADGLPPAAQLNADYVVLTHPPQWSVARISQRDTFHDLTIGEVKSNFPFHRIVPDVKDPIAFIRAQMKHAEGLQAKVPGLEAMFEFLANGDSELLTAYGLSFEGEGPLTSIIYGLERARAKSPQSFLPKVVIALTSNLNEQEWNLVREYLRQLKFDLNKLHVVNAKDQNVGEKLISVDAGEIAIVQIGSVTQDVWNYLMEQSTLPPVVAGANGVDYASQMGKPFLMTNQDVIIKNYTMPDDLHSQMERLQLELKRMEPYDLTDFFIDSKNPQSATYKSFRDYAQTQCALPDRTCTALLATKDIWLPTAMQTKFCKNEDVRAFLKNNSK